MDDDLRLLCSFYCGAVFLHLVVSLMMSIVFADQSGFFYLSCRTFSLESFGVGLLTFCRWAES